MIISRLGLEVIKHFEGFMSCPYLCPAGVATIGYGTTIYPDGSTVQMTDQCITEQEASELLESQVNDVYGDCVNENTTAEATQCQFDALVSLCYNIGCSAFAGSTLLECFNAQDLECAYNEFDSWVYVSGEVSQGLQNRRDLEQALFMLC